MIIWSGYGFLVFLIVIVNSLIVNLITDLISGTEGFYQTNLIPLGISLLFSGLIIKILAKYFSKKRKAGSGTYIFDKVTIAHEDKHTFFFIQFPYWSYINVVIGTALIICQILRHH